jgi:hypothetical protein
MRLTPQLLAIFHKNQFAGDDIEEDPYKHLDFFTDICGTFKLNSCIDDEVMLKLFNQSLTGTVMSTHFYSCRHLLGLQVQRFVE